MSVPAAYLGIIVIWSTTPLAIKWSSEGSTALFGVASRMVISSVLCIVLLLILRKTLPLRRDAVASYIIAGLALYVAMTCVYIGTQFIPSGLVSVVFGFSPLVTSLLATVWLAESSFTRTKIAGLALAIGGLGIVFRDSFDIGDQALLGIGLVFVATAVHSGSAVWLKKIKTDLSAIALTSGSLITALPLFIATWYAFDGYWPAHVSPQASWAIAYLALFGSVLGFLLYFYALKRVKATKMALLTLITPVLALLIGQHLNHETISWHVWGGTVLILSGIAWHEWGNQRQKD